MTLFDYLSLEIWGKKFANLTFNMNIDDPVKSETIFNDSNYRASGSWYWKGDVVGNSPAIVGKDCHIYIRTQYEGNFAKKQRIEFHTMQSTISENEIKFNAKKDDSTHTYTFSIDNIIQKANTFIMDSTTERAGKLITKNFVHFSSKDLHGREYEGYLVFTDNAVDKKFKQYLLNRYTPSNS